MKTHTLLLFLMVTTFFSCTMNDKSRQEEADTVRKLVLLRTEGLALAEFMRSKAINADIIQWSDRLTIYYEQTHPEFLRACAGSKLELHDADFDSLWFALSERFAETTQPIEKLGLALCEENIRTSISVYERIIRRQDWERIGQFSFLALPDLYNQQQELHSIKSNFQRQHTPVKL